MINHRGLHFDPEAWDQPEQFKPGQLDLFVQGARHTRPEGHFKVWATNQLFFQGLLPPTHLAVTGLPLIQFICIGLGIIHQKPCWQSRKLMITLTPIFLILLFFNTTERFLNDNGQLLAKLPESFLPFGCGRRVCLGEEFAKKELFLIFTWLFSRYTFYKVPGKEAADSLMKPTEASGFVHQPFDEIEVCVKKRFETVEQCDGNLTCFFFLLGATFEELKLKALDTLGYCQRPVFSLDLSQYLCKITNL